MVERTQNLNAPAQGVEIADGPELDLSPEERSSASSQVSQSIERPTAAVLDNDLVKQFETLEQGSPAPEAPKSAPEVSNHPVSELAKEPAVRAALEKALTDGSIKYQSLRDVVQKGLDTGNFEFKSAGQERALKGIIAPAISAEPAKPAPAQEKTPETGGPASEAPTPEHAPEQAKTGIAKAIEDIDAKMPNGLDQRVKDALANSPAVSALEQPGFKKGGFQTNPPSLGDATRYANQMAVKTDDFEPASVEANFKQAFEQPNKTALYKLAEDQGLRLYPTTDAKPEGAGRATRDLNSPLKADGLYARAIESAKEKGVELPAPADPAKGYTLAEAQGMKEKNLIDLDSVARARETPKPAAEKPLANPQDRDAVVEKLNAGFMKDGAAQKGLPFDQSKSLSFQSKNEVRAIVGKLSTGDLQTAAAGIVVTAALAKEFKEKVLKEQDQPAGATA